MRYSSSPAGTSKMSMLSMGSNAILDAVLCVSHMILSAAISKALNYSYVIVVSFLQLILFGILEMRVLMKILVARYICRDSRYLFDLNILVGKTVTVAVRIFVGGWLR
jgi:hypothetical protein